MLQLGFLFALCICQVGRHLKPEFAAGRKKIVVRTQQVGLVGFKPG